MRAVIITKSEPRLDQIACRECEITARDRPGDGLLDGDWLCPTCADNARAEIAPLVAEIEELERRLREEQAKVEELQDTLTCYAVVGVQGAAARRSLFKTGYTDPLG